MNNQIYTEGALIDLLKGLNIFTPFIEKAMLQAQKSHGMQLRDTGGSYLEEHIYPIAADLALKFQTDPKLEELIITALLHDAVEDDIDFSIEKCQMEFGENIAKNISFLTKKRAGADSRALSQEEKMERNRKNMERFENAPEAAKMVKLADRLNNINSLDAIKGTSKFDRYIKETREIFLPFAKKISQQYYLEMKKVLENYPHSS